MKTLNFKQNTSFKKGKVYSVCLRNCRRYATNNENSPDLQLISPNQNEI